MAATELFLLKSISRPIRDCRDTVSFSYTLLLSPPHMNSAICTRPRATMETLHQMLPTAERVLQGYHSHRRCRLKRPILNVFGHQQCATPCQRGSPYPLLSLGGDMIEINEFSFFPGGSSVLGTSFYSTIICLTARRLVVTTF